MRATFAWGVLKIGKSRLPDEETWWEDEADAAALFDEPDLHDDGEDE